MKRTILISFLILSLLTLTACTIRIGEPVSPPPTAEASPSDRAEAPTDAALPAPVSATEALPGTPGNAETSPATLPASETDIFVELSAEDCIEDVGEEPGHLARITLDCDGASSINSDILRDLRPLAEDPICDIRYELYKYDNILSLVYIESYDWESTYYHPFVLDLSTGERLSGAELTALLGIGEEALAEEELMLMGSEYENRYAMAREQAGEFYDEQYNRTVSLTNVETERLWLDDFGRLYFAARIYSLAGADYYEQPMTTNFSY